MSTQQTTFDPALLNAAMDDVNLEADAFAEIPPPPQGDNYFIRFGGGTKGAIADVDKKTNKPYVYVNFVAVVADGEYSGRRFYGFWNSKPDQFRGGASEIHTFIQRCGSGGELRPGMSANELRDLLNRVLADAVILGPCKIKWTATYVPQLSDGTKDYKSKRTLAKRMMDFPLVDPNDLSKGHIPEIYDPESKTTIKAEIELVSLGRA